jgi:ABC-type transport system involved in multi-copper enzyme maturation permease subunit
MHAIPDVHGNGIVVESDPAVLPTNRVSGRFAYPEDAGNLVMNIVVLCFYIALSTLVLTPTQGPLCTFKLLLCLCICWGGLCLGWLVLKRGYSIVCINRNRNFYPL